MTDYRDMLRSAEFAMAPHIFAEMKEECGVWYYRTKNDAHTYLCPSAINADAARWTWNQQIKSHKERSQGLIWC